MKSVCVRTILAFVACTFLGSSPALAQAVRTWVSGVGNDADPCSRTAPCRTFAGAIAATAAGGEISVLDPGAYGTVTITKPITISGVGTQASILATATVGVFINITTPPTAPQTNTVTLRNIQINGAGSVLGLQGVRVLGNTTVVLDHVNIFGFGTSGVLAEDTSKVTITDGNFFNNSGRAIHAVDSAQINLENSMVNGNNIAVQADLGSTIRMSNNAFYDNKTAFACGTGGTLASANNNRKANNVGGIVATCTPTVAITIQ